MPIKDCTVAGGVIVQLVSTFSNPSSVIRVAWPLQSRPVTSSSVVRTRIDVEDGDDR